MTDKIFFRIGCALILLNCLSACKTKVVTVRYEGRVSERYQVDRASNVRNGYYRVYHDNGKLALEHQYQNGQLNGMERIYHEDGSLSGELPLKNDNYHGNFRYYHPNGQLKQEGRYEEDALTGELCNYYENGQLKECVTLVDNTEQGPFREYSKEGTLVRSGNYISLFGDQEGLEHGLIYEYDAKTRRLLRKKRCEEGFCCTLWERDKGYLKPSTSVCEEILQEAELRKQQAKE